MSQNRISFAVIFLLSLVLPQGIRCAFGDEGCKSQTDIVIVIDQSSNIHPNDYQEMKYFVTSIGRKFGISKRLAHISLILAYHDTEMALHLDDIQNEDNFFELVKSLIHFRDPYIQLGKALKKARQEIKGSASRHLSKKIVIVLSNGKSRDGIVDDAIALREESDMVYVIGFGRFQNQNTFNMIASAPENVFSVPTGINAKEKLEKIAYNIMDINCKACSVDVCFLIDTSVASNQVYLSRIKMIIELYIKVFSAGKYSRFGMVEASGKPRVALDLVNASEAVYLKHVLNNIKYSENKNTKVLLGISLSIVKDDIYHKSFQDTKKLLVVFSNGMSNDSPEVLALKLRFSKVFTQVYTFGKNQYTPNIIVMATAGSKNNIINNAERATAERKALEIRAALCGECQDTTIYCGQMALWGLCRISKMKEKCKASCQVCYKSPFTGWMQKWKNIMRLKGPFSKRIYRFKS